MDIVTSDQAFFQEVPEGQAPNYDRDNPIMRVVRLIETIGLAAEREHYLPDCLQYLIPFEEAGLYGPSDSQRGVADPTVQDNKNDFQKQNVATFKTGDMFFVRGYAVAGEWTGSFVKLSYQDSPFSALAQVSGGSPGRSLRLYVRIGEKAAPNLIVVPYNPATGSYEVELWSWPGSGGELRSLLGEKGKAALDLGVILARPDLVQGARSAFSGAGFDQDRENAARSNSALDLYDRQPAHAMHPVRPLHLEVAWANETATGWDSKNGMNHHYEFNMTFRGWDHYFQVGQTKNPHGGVGFLEFRNLFSNYFGHEGRRKSQLGERWKNELGRDLRAWNFDANTWRPAGEPGPKSPDAQRESFLAVDYMDLHILQPDCGIGIHRHRDNQEVFFLLSGKALMLVGDWCKFPGRERAFEVRTMGRGDLTICRTGQLHALFNALDEPCSLFMFGGYD